MLRSGSSLARFPCTIPSRGVPQLTREGSLFDARPDAFGSYRVVDEIRAGRSGRVYRAQEPATGAFVIVKVFDLEVTPEQAGALAIALERLCRAPLDHPSIVAPLAAGIDGDRPWMAEPQVDGDTLDAVMRSGEPVADVLLRITQLAGALDFAAAAGIRHGALGPRDIIISGDRTLVACLGVQQALAQAGVAAPMRDDVQVLAAIAGEWLAGVQSERVRTVLETAASRAHTGSALEFAATLQNAVAEPQTAVAEPHAAVRDPEPAVPLVVDADLRAVEAEPRFADADLGMANRGEPFADREERIADRAERTADRGERIADSDARWLPMAAMLAIGLLGGFAAGFVVGQRDATPVPHAAERAVRRPAPDRETPAPTAGRDATEADAPTAVEEPELRLPSAPATRNQEQGTRNPEPGTNNQAPGTGNPEPAQLVVDSRPRGARVFVDGRLVGQTPLTLPRVTPGEHAVRIDLLGYQRWMTRVTVAPGERTRVAASLER